MFRVLKKKKKIRKILSICESFEILNRTLYQLNTHMIHQIHQK